MSVIFYHRNFNKFQEQNKCSIFIRFPPVRKKNNIHIHVELLQNVYFLHFEIKSFFSDKKVKRISKHTLYVCSIPTCLLLFFYNDLIRLLHNKYIGNLDNIFFLFPVYLFTIILKDKLVDDKMRGLIHPIYFIKLFTTITQYNLYQYKWGRVKE